MGFESAFLICAIIFGFYMAWNIGANDMANSMASAVGAEAITLRQAVIIGSILCIIGAVFVGSHVTETIKKGIVDTTSIGNLDIIVKGLLASLLAASLWITFATWFAWPVSTTHSIVGALVGFGLFAAGFDSIHWHKVIEVVVSWVTSPFFAGVLGFIVFKIIRSNILTVDNSEKASLKIMPIFIGLTFFVIAGSLLFRTPIGENLNLSLSKSLFTSLIISVIAGICSYFAVQYMIKKGAKVEGVFRAIQVMTSCYIAFSIGSNDVANAIGPVAGIFGILKKGALQTQVETPVFLLALGGIGIAVGMATWGYRVIATVGRKITHLTNSRGFSIDFSAATTVLIASKMGIPISTTHSVVGAVCGVGLAGGLDAVDFRVVKKIIVSWIITLPAAAITSILFFKLLMWLF